MWSKVDVRDIVRDHLNTLHDGRSLTTPRGGRKQKRSTGDLVVMYVAPLVVGGVLVAVGIRLRTTTGLLTAVSVFSGFLFALLLTVLQLSASAAANRPANGVLPEPALRRVRLLREIAANVAYSAVAAIVAVGVLGADALTATSGSRRTVPNTAAAPSTWWYTLIAIATLLHVLLTVVMVIKRVYRLSEGELNRATSIAPSSEVIGQD